MGTNKKLTALVAGRAVKEVHQQDAALEIAFADGSILRIKLEDPASSVMLRNAAGQLEYTD